MKLDVKKVRERETREWKEKKLDSFRQLEQYEAEWHIDIFYVCDEK